MDGEEGMIHGVPASYSHSTTVIAVMRGSIGPPVRSVYIVLLVPYIGCSWAGYGGGLEISAGGWIRWPKSGNSLG